MLTRYAKRAAAQDFHLPDRDATDSTTASESELERLEEYPKLLSPRSGSKRFKDRIAELAGPNVPIKKATAAKLGHMDDGLRSFAVQRKKKEGGVKKARPGVEGAEDVGMGGVVMDAPVVQRAFEQSDEEVMRNEYAAYQLRLHQTQAYPHRGENDHDVPLSNMGFFASLPGELRNRIYRLALVKPHGPFNIVMQPGTCSLGPCTHMKLPTAVPGVLSSCRQIRYEAMPIFCAENTFKFDAKTVKERCTANWLRALGPYARLIASSVSIEIIVWEDTSPTNFEKVGRPYVMTIENQAPSDGIILDYGGFILRLEGQIQAKAPDECAKVFKHVVKLNERFGQVSREQLLLEFLWSDWMAELVFRCGK
ncbi:hypothetical protein LTR37_017176 [Vermiconidia calcicola]|uniref:Uncharacterized protein n=1 Tax=Vermiconidia calcicola TaxID=1690605 RepID=A0ACC3MKT1_9PEZI|nr:hypothetical protein LTR37_017176 [Vermiconidia calcicola]